MDPRYDTVGVAYGPHCTFGSMAAMEFAKRWEADVDSVRFLAKKMPPFFGSFLTKGVYIFFYENRESNQRASNQRCEKINNDKHKLKKIIYENKK